MAPKVVFLILALLNGSWMIFDGSHVLVKKKYFGPPEPGPWSRLVKLAGLNPFSLGPMFVVLGGLWIAAALSILIIGNFWAWLLGMAVAICTLWYVSAGTIISLLAIAMLVIFAKDLGYS